MPGNSKRPDLVGIRQFLVGIELIDPGQSDDDHEVYLDSLGLTWLIHSLGDEYGVEVPESDSPTLALLSVRRLHTYLASLRACRGSA